MSFLSHLFGGASDDDSRKADLDCQTEEQMKAATVAKSKDGVGGKVEESAAGFWDFFS